MSSMGKNFFYFLRQVIRALVFGMWKTRGRFSYLKKALFVAVGVWLLGFAIPVFARPITSCPTGFPTSTPPGFNASSNWAIFWAGNGYTNKFSYVADLTSNQLHLTSDSGQNYISPGANTWGQYCYCTGASYCPVPDAWSDANCGAGGEIQRTRSLASGICAPFSLYWHDSPYSWGSEYGNLGTVSTNQLLYGCGGVSVTSYPDTVKDGVEYNINGNFSSGWTSLTIDGVAQDVVYPASNSTTIVFNAVTSGDPRSAKLRITYGDCQGYVEYDTFIAPSSLIVTSPVSGGTVQSGNTQISGKCPINGENRIIPNGGFYWEEYYNSDEWAFIDCVNYNWNANINVINSESTRSYNVYEREYGNSNQNSIYKAELELRGVEYSGDGSLDGWGLNVLYPQAVSEGFYKIYTGSGSYTNFPFKIGYVLPSDVFFANDTSVFLEVFSSDKQSSQTVLSSGLVTLDGDQNGYFYVDIPVNTSTRFYRLTLLTNIDDVTVWRYSLDFTVKAVDDDTLPVPQSSDSKDDLGFWGNIVRGLFVPSKQAMNSAYARVSVVLDQKVPVLSKVIDDFRSKLRNTSRTTSLSDISLALGAFGTQSFPISRASGMVTQAKPFVTGLVVFFFLWWLFVEVSHLFSKE